MSFFQPNNSLLNITSDIVSLKRMRDIATLRFNYVVGDHS